MQLRRPPMVRTLLVPALVLLLVMGAVGTITALQTRSRHSADAQLKLARAETALNVLQVAPFRAVPMLGGSPQIARGLLDDGEREIDRLIAELARDSAPETVGRMPAMLRGNYATLERIYAIAITAGFDDRTAPLAGRALHQSRQIVTQMRAAGGVYEQRSRTADRRATIGTATVMLLLVAAFGLLYRRSIEGRAFAEGLVVENGRLLSASRIEALTDSLTTLPNRRSLRRDLDDVFSRADDTQEHVLALFDLDGFKQYNDTFGHPAGDALLNRLGACLSRVMDGRGTAYRMGGDEFCVLAVAAEDGGAALVATAAEALSEAGEAFDIGCSHGRARIRTEAATAEDALRLADQRMYVHKAGHALPSRIGKVAIPDAILHKVGPLNDEEWAFMHRHTVIGERIIRSAASLAPAASLVRSSHERHDGTGYPDGLPAEEIELGASIIGVCDAYDAMVGRRAYRPSRTEAEAIAELRRCAGTHFDAAVVDLLCEAVEQRDVPLAAGRGSGQAGAAAPA